MACSLSMLGCASECHCLVRQVLVHMCKVTDLCGLGMLTQHMLMLLGVALDTQPLRDAACHNPSKLSIKGVHVGDALLL